MTERRDDTTKPADESRPARGAGRYYYDDATGYEPYRPEEDGEEPDEESDEESGEGPGEGPGEEGRPGGGG